MAVQRVVFAGGPGSGKTTLLRALHAKGYTVAADSARNIIRDRRGQGLSPRPEPTEFAHEVLRRDIQQYLEHQSASGPVFFERGVVDALGMLSAQHAVSGSELQRQLMGYPYHRQVFVFPPWEAIYLQDTERDQTFAEAQRVFEAVRKWYRECGYEVVEMPKVSVAERCEHVLHILGTAA